MVIRREEGGFFISNMGWGLLLAVLIPGIGALIATGESLREVAQHSSDLGKVWSNIGAMEQTTLLNRDRLTKLEDKTENTDKDRARNIGRLDSLEHLVGVLQLQVAKVDTVSEKLDKQEMERNKRWDDQNNAIAALVNTLDGFRKELSGVSTNIAVLAKTQENSNTRMDDILSGRIILPNSGDGSDGHSKR